MTGVAFSYFIRVCSRAQNDSFSMLMLLPHRSKSAESSMSREKDARSISFFALVSSIIAFVGIISKHLIFFLLIFFLLFYTFFSFCYSVRLNVSIIRQCVLFDDFSYSSPSNRHLFFSFSFSIIKPFTFHDMTQETISYARLKLSLYIHSSYSSIVWYLILSLHFHHNFRQLVIII